MNVSNLTMGNKRHSQVLDLLRFPLAIVIVIVHVFYGQSRIVIHGVEYFFEGMTAYSFFTKFVFAFLRDQSVPIYFFISGYVFFLIDGVFSKSVYTKKIKNRIKTLLIPYILWNVIALLFAISFYYPPLSAFVPGLNSADLNWSLNAILNTFWDAHNNGGVLRSTFTTVRNFPQNGVLWFIRDLMFLSLMSPLLYAAVKKLKCYFVCFVGCIWFCMMLVSFEYGQMLVGLFFFSLGAYFSINKLDMVHQFGKYSKLSFLLYPLLGTIYIVLSYMSVPALVLSIIKAMNIFVGLFFAYNLAALILEKGIFRTSPFLTSSSFFIYVTHWIIMDNVVRLFFVLLKPTSDLGVLGTYLLATLMIIALILIVYWLMRRFTPRLLGVLVGRRA